LFNIIKQDKSVPLKTANNLEIRGTDYKIICGEEIFPIKKHFEYKTVYFSFIDKGQL